MSSKKGYSRSGSGKGTPKAKKTDTDDDDITVTVLPSQKDNLVHPAQHFDYDNNWMSFGFIRTVEINNPEWNRPKRKRMLCLVTNSGEVIPCIEPELARRGITLAAPPMWNEKKGNRMSGTVLDGFIASRGKRPVSWSLKQWLEFTIEQLKGMLDYENEDIFISTALWVFGTYCHRIFESFAYRFYHGPTQSGKTRSLETLEEMCFNAILSPNMSPSSLFRSVESMACTLLMDETETIKEKEGAAEIRQLILSGYKRGASVTRSEPIEEGGFRVVEYSTYSPKAFANISGLDDVLGNRTIPTLMRRSKLRYVLTAKLFTRKRRRYWQDIRDHAYLLIYNYWRRITELADQHADAEVIEGVEGRPLELWYPIFVLAELFEENGCSDLCTKMHELAKQYVTDMVAQFEQSNEGSMIHALRYIMWDADPPFNDAFYRFQDIKRYFAKQVAFADEETDTEGHTIEKAVKVPTWVRPAYIYGVLRKLGFKEFEGKGGNKRVHMNKPMLVDLWERYIGDWEEPSQPSGGQMTIEQVEPAYAESGTQSQLTNAVIAEAKGMVSRPREQQQKKKQFTNDTVCETMLDKIEWTAQGLQDWLVNVYEFDEADAKAYVEKTIDGSDPRVVTMERDGQTFYRVTDPYREMKEKDRK